MKLLKITSVLFLFLLFLSASCEENSKKINESDPKPPENNDPQPGTLAPVETKKANSDYKPAFEGQTRIAGTKTETSYEVKVVAKGLSSPWSVKFIPDGRMVITEKAGTLRIATADGTIGNPVTGFPAVDNRNQGGLLDVEPAPDFSTSRVLYFTLAEKTPQGSLTAVGKGKLSADETKIENFEIIYRAVPYYDNSMHFGSRIVFSDDGNIFVSTGERSDLATRPKAQLLDNGYGKVVHITPEGKPVPGNPFINTEGAMAEIYSYGHRNAQGLAIHPVTRELWLSEMGPRGGDEINLIKPGINYGWSSITYGIEYSGAIISGGATQKEGLEQPVYYWDPVLSPSGMTFYASDVIPEWQNNLFIGGLSSKHIARIVLKDNKVIAEERLLEKENQRFRDITEGPDGALWAVTDEGRLYRISKK